MLKDRKDCMAEIDKAISRYDGHTTYAKMANIVQILVSPLFDEKPACYVAELIPEIQRMLGREDSASNTKKRVAADAHIQHGISLGLLERVISGGEMSHYGIKSKIDETMRVAPSSLGRTCRVAIKKENYSLEKFLLTYALLEHDFDMYGLLIKLTAESEERSAVYKKKFTSGANTIYSQRKQWLEKKAPANIKHLFQKYMREDDVRRNRTIEHHFNLRVRWAKDLGHLHNADNLLRITDSGKQLADSIVKQVGQSMFWIAPSRECVRKVGIIDERAEEIFSAWDILRPAREKSDPSEEIVERIAEFMISAYEHIRLRVFNQAPLGAIIPYIHFLECQLNQKVDIKKAFRTVLHRHRDRFSCMLGAVPQKSVYKLRRP